MTDLADLERRVADLERRLDDLASGNGDVAALAPVQSEVAGAVAAQTPSQADPATALIDLQVVNKRYQPENHVAGVYQDAIWFDCVLTLHPQAKATRAVKGTIEFCDVFGDPRFVIGYTINDTLHPGRPFQVQGIGFDYNQYINEHQWMLVTELKDIVTRFRVHQVMYVDGSSERLI